MSTHTPGSNDDRKRLDIARRVYKALIVCDASGRVLARNERRPREEAAEKASQRPATAHIRLGEADRGHAPARPGLGREGSRR